MLEEQEFAQLIPSIGARKKLLVKKKTIAEVRMYIYMYM